MRVPSGPAKAVRLPRGCQVTPSADVTATGCGAVTPEMTCPTAIQPAGPCATLVRVSTPGSWYTAGVAADTRAQAPSAARRQIAGWPSAVPTASQVPPADASERIVTEPCWPG